MAEIITGYGILKEIFDKVRTGVAVPIPFDDVSNIYRNAFGTKLSYLPKYVFTISVHSNPVQRIVLFCNNGKQDIHHGVIPGVGGPFYICSIDEIFDFGITADNVDKYIEQVYNTIRGIVSKDKFNICGPDEPYGIFIRSVAFYMTFHHVYNVAFDALNKADEHVFDKYLREFIANEEDISKVMQSISGEEFTPTFESICHIMTCGDTVKFK